MVMTRIICPEEARIYQEDISNCLLAKESFQTLSESSKKSVKKSGEYVFRMSVDATQTYMSFKALLELHRAGLPVEQPLMIIEVPMGPILVTKFIEGPNYEESISKQNIGAEMQKLGTSMYSFHSRGYLVPDTHIGNFISERQYAVRIDVNYIDEPYSSELWTEPDERSLPLLKECRTEIYDGVLITLANGLSKQKKTASEFDLLASSFVKGYNKDETSDIILQILEKPLEDVRMMMDDVEKTGNSFVTVYNKKLQKDIRAGKIDTIRIFSK